MTLRFAIPSRSARAVTAAVVVGVVLAMLAPCALADNRPHKPRKENKHAESKQIEVLENQWHDAMVKADTVQLDKLLSDDFLGISANGKLSNKEQYLQRLQRRQNQYSNIDVMDMKVRIQPGTAVVTSQARVTGVLDGRPIDGVFRYTKVYSRMPGGAWQVTNFEATRVSGPEPDDTEMHGGQPLRSSNRLPTPQ